jgi:hypothetical protein
MLESILRVFCKSHSLLVRRGIPLYLLLDVIGSTDLAKPFKQRRVPPEF